MKIFVDFDNTIFDTRHHFLDGFFDVFYKYGVSRAKFDDTLLHFSKTALQSGKCYSPREHIELINKDMESSINEDVFVKEINEFLENLEDFVFEDFYQFVSSFEKEDLIILSYGEDEFQRQKIKGSGVEQFFIDTIITQGDKTKEIENYMQNFPNERAVLIDDKRGYFNSAKKSDIYIETVHIVRSGESCDEDEFCDKDISDLSKVSDIMNA